MSTIIIPAKLIKPSKTFLSKNEGLDISEFFCDTLQGEGKSIGTPSTFLRLKGCTLSCHWCDTTEVWQQGNAYSFEEIFSLIEQYHLHIKLKTQHLVITGGSPLKQQTALVNFIQLFIKKYGYKPFIEVENEVVLPIEEKFSDCVDQWNNSPKLENSGMRKNVRYFKEQILQAAKKNNSWFKFVIEDKKDWEEIEQDFLTPKLIQRNQIILMPQADNTKELTAKRLAVAELVIQNGVIFSDRLHISIYNKKTGV